MVHCPGLSLPPAWLAFTYQAVFFCKIPTTIELSTSGDLEISQACAHFPPRILPHSLPHSNLHNFLFMLPAPDFWAPCFLHGVGLIACNLSSKAYLSVFNQHCGGKQKQLKSVHGITGCTAGHDSATMTPSGQ